MPVESSPGAAGAGPEKRWRPPTWAAPALAFLVALLVVSAFTTLVTERFGNEPWGAVGVVGLVLLSSLSTGRNGRPAPWLLPTSAVLLVLLGTPGAIWADQDYERPVFAGSALFGVVILACIFWNRRRKRRNPASATSSSGD